LRQKINQQNFRSGPLYSTLLIIWWRHIEEVSYTWGRYIEKTGYHVRDYFTAQMERFKEIPRAILAHSTHVRGLGSYENGIEKPRIDVILATSIPEGKCKMLNLGYLDPGKVRIDEYMNREGEGILFVDHAGEILHRLENERPSRSNEEPSDGNYKTV